MITIGTSRRSRVARTVLVVLQVFLLLFSAIGPVATYGADPADPSPSAEPTTPADPSPSADPTAAPDPTPTPDPTPLPTPDPTPLPTPDPTPLPTPDPTAEPTASPTPEPSASPAQTSSYIVTFASGVGSLDQVAALTAAGVVSDDYILVLRMHAVRATSAQADALRADPLVASVELDRSRAAEAVPSDSQYADQWSLPKIGWDQAFGVVAPTGSSVVAVLDTGVDASHPDLDDNIVGGASFVAGSSWNADPNGHGTAMAGIVAAETDNGQGVAGVGYAGVKVMPISVLDSNGLGRDSDIIEGVVWAADHGADVILMAFSASGYSTALQAAIDYAWSQGALLVAATGNDGSSANTFPAGDAGVIGVSATDQNDALAGFSNYGEAVFLCAPGASIPALGGAISGTSAAAAHVAGAAALLAAVDGTASNGVIVGRLARNADVAGTADQTGNGRLNLARALADISTEAVKPAGAEPGDGGPFVGPYLLAANNDGHVAPQWAPGSAITTFNVLYRKTTGGTVQHVRVTLPVGYTSISVGETAFSSGTWSTPVVNQVTRTVDVQLTSGTGLAIDDVSWARIDITATTPPSQNGNAAKWLLETFTDTAGTTGKQDDEPAVLVNDTTDPSATITFRDPVTGVLIPTPVLEDDAVATLSVRITQAGSGIKYIDVAIPTCFSSPTNITTTSSAGGNGGYVVMVTDNFIRLRSGSIPTNGFLTVKFDTTPDCVSGTYVVSTSPSTNATNPPSTTNQSVSTTGGSLTIVAGLSDLSITKTDTPDPVNVGGTLTYTIGVNNAGPDPASAVKVVDTLPAGTTFVSASGTDWNCVNVLGTVTCNRTAGNLPVGPAPNITIVVLAPLTPGSITNSATVSSPNDNTPGNNTATATTTVANQADLSVTKSDGVTTVTAGDGVVRTYTITISNAGPSTAAAVSLSDTWPAGFTRGTVTPSQGTCTGSPSFTCALGAINSGADATVTVTYTVPASTTASPQDNTVTVSSTTADPNAANNTATDSNTVATSADLSITKTDGVTGVTAGDGNTYTYTITVSNSGVSDAQGVSFTDTWPAGFTRGTLPAGCSNVGSGPDFSCSLGTIAAGGSATKTITYTVPSTTTLSPQVNSVTVNSTTTDPDTANNTATDSNTVTVTADLSVTKTDGQSSVIAGTGPYTYTIVVTNGGPSTATGVSLSDTWPAGFTRGTVTPGFGVTCADVGSGPDFTCDLGSIAPLAMKSVTVTYTVPANTAAGTQTNTVSVTSPTPDPDTADRTASDSTTVVGRADLAITKSGSPSPVTAGNDLTYTITVTNTSDATNGTTATGITVSDSLPANTSFVSVTGNDGFVCTETAGSISCSLASLAPEASATITYVVNVAPSFTGPSVSNTASVATSGTHDPDPTDNTATETTPVVVSADLSVTKTDGVTSVIAGDGVTYTYTIVVTNGGPSTATEVDLFDTWPAGFSRGTVTPGLGVNSCDTTEPDDFTCDIGSLAPGSSKTVTVTYTVPSTTDSGSQTNTATVSAYTADPDDTNDTASDTNTVVESVVLSVVKTFNSATVTAGGAGQTFTISITNTGVSDADIVTLTDTVDGRLMVGSVAAGDFACTDGDSNPQTITCSLAHLGAGVTKSITVTYSVASTTDSDLSVANTATGDSDEVSSTNGADSVAIVENVVLEITKHFDDDSVDAGTTGHTFTITVENTGLSDADDLTVSDTVDGRLIVTGVSAPDFSCTDLDTNPQTITCSRLHLDPSDGPLTITVTYSVAASTAAGTVSNIAATASDEVTPPVTSTDTVDITISADLDVDKSALPDPATAGTDETFTITVTNQGPSDNAGYTLTDVLPADTTFVSASGACADSDPSGTVTCTSTGLAAGASDVFTITVHIASGFTDGGTLSNTAAIATNATPDPDSSNDSATSTTTVNRSADVADLKVDTEDPVTAGTSLTYTIIVTNNGPSDAASVTLTDDLPDELTDATYCIGAGCSPTTPWPLSNTIALGDIVADTSVEVTITATVDPSTPAGTLIINMATAQSPTDDPDSFNNADTEDTTVVTSADLSVVKSDSPDPVVAGTNLAYTITINNGGPSDAQTVVLTDGVPANTTFVSATAPAGWTLVTPGVGGTGTVTATKATLAAGETATFSIVVKVDASAADGSTLSNTATVSSATDDPNTANNADTEPTAVIARADLAVTKTDSPDPVTAGTNLTYTIGVTNNGPSDAQAVSLTDSVPAGTTFVSLTAPAGWTCTTPTIGGNGTVTCTIPTLAAAASATFTLVVKVDANVPDGATLTNTAAVSSTTTDPTPLNNTDTETTGVIAEADIEATKTDTPDPVTAGTPLVYTIVLTNHGPSDAQAVSLSDPLPTNTTFLSLSPAPGWTCTTPAVGATGTVSCSVASVAAGTSATFTLVVKVDASAPDGSTIVNGATGSSSTTDPDPSNNTGTATTTVTTEADLSATKDDGATTVTAGDGVTYTYLITVSNGGPSDAQAVNLIDTWPAGFDRGTVSPSQGSCDETDPADFTCDLGVIAAGGSATVTVTYTVPSTTNSGHQTNTVVVSSPTSDPGPSANGASDTNAVLEDVRLSVVKTFADATVTAGAPGTHTFTIQVTNNGLSDADNVFVEDNVDPALHVLGATATGGGDCSGTSGNLVSCGLAHLAGNGGTVTVTVTYDVLSTTNTQTVHNFGAGRSDEDTQLSDDETVEVIEDVHLSVVKTFQDATVTAGAAGTHTFTIVVTNNGVSDADFLVLNDAVPSALTVTDASSSGATCGHVGNDVSCTLSHLAAGGSFTVTVTYTVTSSVDSQIIHNTALVDADEDSEESNDATVQVVEETALTASKSDGKTEVAAGTSGSYTISLTNAGPSDADHVILDDTIPDPLVAGAPVSSLPADCTASVGNTIHCQLTASLAAGATWTITVSYSVPASATPTSVTNVAVFTTDEVPTGTSASDDTNVVRHADLSITKTATPASVFSGDNITYTITVTNLGPSFSSGFTVTDTLSGDVSFVSATSPDCTHSGEAFGGTVTCDHSTDLAVNDSVTYTIVVKTRFPLAPTTISNTATVDGDDTDPNGANDTATITTPIILRPATGSSTMTDSAFKIQTDLSPWTITDFEILVNNQNTIVATNPGQFYYHQRVTNIDTGTLNSSVDFEIDWPTDFVPQTSGGMPIHAYVRLDGTNTWTDWTPQSTGICWSADMGCPTSAPAHDGTITVNNVPSKAEVWITVHLDLKCKGQSYDTCMKATGKDPMKVPFPFGPFMSRATVRIGNIPLATSTTSTSLLGRGKKVTVVYGTVSGTNGDLVEDTWVRVKQGTNYALTKTDSNGFYVFFDDQYCTGDGLLGCSGWSGQVKFASGTSSATLAVLGNGAYSPTWVTDTPARPVPYTSGGTTSLTFNVAKGSAYNKNFGFN
jgi:uncharacterized repeat protein (TIGR01451 family)